MTAITLFIGMAVVWLSLLMAHVGRVTAEREKIQTVSDASVLCSLRMRVEALETLAARWKEFGVLLGPVAGERMVELPAANWSTVETKAAALKSALPGYQGRTAAIIKVVAEANGFSRDQIEIEDDAAARLGVVAEPFQVRDAQGHIKTIPGGWLRRTWDLDQVVKHDIEGKKSVGALFHDAQEIGNGGYPQNWNEAVSNGRLDPFRWPVFRAGLVER